MTGLLVECVETMAELSAPIAGCWWRPFRSIGGIVVFHVDLTPHPGHEAEAFEWLDDGERSRWQRFQSLAARRRFTLCRAALRAVLCRHIICTNESLAFVATKHGKPFAEVGGNPVAASFNVGHSGRHGLVAVAHHGQLGVDLEDRAPRRNLDGLIKAVFSPDEQAGFEHLVESQKLQMFFRLWTLKEALAKACGKGISSMAVSELEIPVEMRLGSKRSVCQFSQIPGMTWYLEDLGNEEFAAAVAYEAE